MKISEEANWCPICKANTLYVTGFVICDYKEKRHFDNNYEPSTFCQILIMVIEDVLIV